MKVLTKIVLAGTLTVSSLIACGDVFVNKGGFHVSARSMEFGANVGWSTLVRYVGQKQTSDIIINLDKIPQQQILSWNYDYGFVGRGDAFRPNLIADGLNTQGVTVSLLYLPGFTDYPKFNPKDTKKAINVNELGAYILSKAKSTAHAIRLLEKVQVVEGAIELIPGKFFKGLPFHYSIRDKNGKSAVIEFIKGKVVIHKNAGNVMTNSPTYDWQVKNAAKYASLKITNTKHNKEFENRYINYKYDVIDLKNIDFNTLPMGNAKEFKARTYEEAKKLEVIDGATLGLEHIKN